jgi:hypothetical protein
MMIGWRKRGACVAGLLAALTLAGCEGPTHSASRSVLGMMPAASDDARACGRPAIFPRGTADEIMAGRLTVAPFAPVTIDPRRDGHIDWSQDPYHHPTWRVYYRSGNWIEALTERYLAGGTGAAAYRDRAAALLNGWLRQVPVQERDLATLICAAEAFPGKKWIHDPIPRLVNYNIGHWMGAWNHGLKQNLEILRIGCGYPPVVWGGLPLIWRDLARREMIKAFEQGPLGPAIDTQGATNEQSTGYASFVYHLYRETEQRLSACGIAVPDVMRSRVALIPQFIAEATQPDGKLVQIGDTYATRPYAPPGTPIQFAASRGKVGSPPRQRVAVYRTGYIFGRSGWGPRRLYRSASFYSLRFGRGSQVHGHDDHMSVTYYARGRNLLVNSGHTGYETTSYRAYLLSPEASNVLVMPGVPFSPAAPTSLVKKVIRSRGQFFEFADTAFGGHPRDRSIYISQHPGLILVFDRASGASRYQQLWHLDPGLSVTTVGRSYAVATAAGTRLLISQIPLPGQVIPQASTRVVRGQTRPYQGWVSRGMLQRIPAPVITMSRTGPSAAILTLIAPTGPSAAVTAWAASQPGGRYRVHVRLGTTAIAFLVNANGDIERG